MEAGLGWAEQPSPPPPPQLSPSCEGGGNNLGGGGGGGGRGGGMAGGTGTLGAGARILPWRCGAPPPLSTPATTARAGAAPSSARRPAPSPRTSLLRPALCAPRSISLACSCCPEGRGFLCARAAPGACARRLLWSRWEVGGVLRGVPSSRWRRRPPQARATPTRGSGPACSPDEPSGWPAERRED